jgi:ABC-type amino acid transport substrate-binding protein
MPSPRAPREGWAAGLAVKKDSSDLAEARQQALNQLVQSGQVGEIFRRHKVSWRPG